MKFNVIYPVTDKEVLSLGFKFMFKFKNQYGLTNTNYYSDKVLADKMLKQILTFIK